MTENITIRTDLRPGDLGRIITLHGEGYEQEAGAFGLTFEAHVARTAAEYILDNGGRGRVWLAERGGELVGCAAIVDRGEKGQLRWIIVSPDARGLRLGDKLISAAMAHAENQNWEEVFLETTPGLDASMRIYQKLGFEVINEEHLPLWTEEPLPVLTMAKKLR